MLDGLMSHEAQLVQWASGTGSGRTYALHASSPGSRPGLGDIILGVKTWLSTLEIVHLSVFRMRQ